VPWDTTPNEIKDLLDKGRDQQAKGYSYTFQKSVDNRIAVDNANGIAVKERGTIRKGTFNIDKQYTADFWVKAIIIDASTNTATGYCDRRECGATPSTRTARTIVFDEWSWPSPSQWLDVRNAEKLAEETIDGRGTDKIAAEWNDEPIVLWVDRFTGMPIQVEVGNDRYVYAEFAPGVPERDVAP
jgi:hypothetical protein